MPICPSCGEDNPERAKFCLACATPLAAEVSPPREVRKTVTVVFSDVTGSTNLGERLDPESLRRVMSRYFDEMRSSLERHGGTVEKFIGDAVMAVFGIPQLHEDDALRAVRAAGDMREALVGLNKELERDWGVEIAIRTGVNTGRVVAGDPAAGQNLVTGDAVNVAARLEQAAEPGEILIGAETFGLVRDAVTVEAVSDLPLKGKAEAVPAFRLVEVAPGAPAHARRLDSPLVGRERERTLLEQAFERAISDRACHLFTVLGPAGVGKSRLVEEFLRKLGDGATVLRGRCLSYGEGITFWPVAEVVNGLADLSDLDPPEEVRRKIAVLLEEEEHAPLVAERVAQVLGLADAAAVPEETFWSIRKLLEAGARARPLVLLFDDVHWAEPTFLDLVEHIADWSRESPILLVCLSRAELLDHRPGWGGGKVNATSILLEPLTEDECASLIANLLGEVVLSGEARARITGAAEGNPLFVEEMLSMLIDDGLLRREDGRWVGAGDLSDVTVPPSIQAILAARLDRLSPEERAVIERASVVGKVFYRGAIQELSPEEERPGVGSHLMTLARKDLIRPDRSDLAGEDAFRFRHLLIRDAAYESMPKETRADLHERLAGWLERATGEHRTEFEEIVGYHLEQAYRYRSELGPVDDRDRALGARAAARLAAAGGRAHGRGDISATVKLLSRATEVLPGDPGRLELLPDLGAALSEAGDFALAEAVLSELIEGARENRARALESHGLLGRLNLLLMTDPEGRTEEARREAERAIEVFEEVGDERGLARAWDLVAMTHWMGARAAAAGEATERAILHARRAGDRRSESMWLLPMGTVFGPAPAAEAIRRCREILERAEGDRSTEAFALVALGWAHAMQGRFEEGRESVARGRAILAELGLKVSAAATAHSAGMVEMLAGDLAEAERVLREAFDELERLGERSYNSTTAAYLAEVSYLRGDHAEAERFSRISEETAATDDLPSQVGWRGPRAKVLAGRGSLDEAEALAREGVTLAERTDDINMQGDALMDLAQVLILAGRPEEAVPHVKKAVELFERKGNVVSARRARTVLTELGAA